MNPIRLPAVAAMLPQLSDATTAEIRQTRHGSIIKLAGSKTFCEIVAPPLPGSPDIPAVDPVVTDAAGLARAAEAVGCLAAVPGPERPLTVIVISPDLAGIVGPAGTPQTIPISKQTDRADTPIDAVQGEVASGMSKQVAVIEPGYLRRLGEVCSAAGITAVEISFAPRWNAILAEGRTPDGSEVAFGVADISGERSIIREVEQKPEAPATASPAKSGSLLFTVAGAKPRAKPAARRSKQERLSFEDDLPF